MNPQLPSTELNPSSPTTSLEIGQTYQKTTIRKEERLTESATETRNLTTRFFPGSLVYKGSDVFATYTYNPLREKDLSLRLEIKKLLADKT